MKSKSKNNFISLLASALLLTIAPTSVQAQEVSNSKIAIGASAKLCLLPLMDGKDLDKNASDNNATLLPENLAKNFKKRPTDKNVYMVKPGEILLLTATKPACSVLIRTLDANEFAEQVKNYYSEANHFESVPSEQRPDSQHLEFKTDLGNRKIMTLVTYSDHEREGGMQGLITMAVTSKDEQ